MTRVVVPVRYPLSARSKRTVERALDVAEDDDADLTVLHVNLYQNGHPITRAELKRAVETEFGRLPTVRYVVRSGFLVEETILDEIAAEDADIVVIGNRQASRWKRLINRLVRDPDIESFLRNHLDCTVITVGG
ncbi:universal stress protein [Halalkalicoccus sp. NIPERK01]|uniref:universal stress protein n=1 Tax=Halalkalicoccus sp. NIPERK01 TaxID=3053469 RepID=UPI00256EDABE|nr:universal stress protein [Halalkalicoccus sp. NIPERK01]